MLKEKVKKIIEMNVYFNAKFYQVFSSSTRNKLVDICNEMLSWDTIDDITQLKKFQNKVARQEIIYYTTDPNFSNMHIYGIWDSLFGDIFDGQFMNYPSVEHGLILHDQIFTDMKHTGRTTGITFSDFRRKCIHKYKKIPIFTIGPYIHYAENFYDIEKIQTLKKKNGKTLLVFPTHSTNTSELDINEKKLFDNVKKVAKNYNTVIVNAFWWNINDKLIQKFEAEGYKITSAGFRDDINFLKRLKTIISLSDLAMGDGIGTNVGYCLACGIPFSFQPSETKVLLKDEKETKDLEFYKYHMKNIENTFENVFDITKDCQQVFEHYWGGNNIKTRNEIKKIYEITKDLVDITKGYTQNINKKIPILLENYIKEDNKKFTLLSDAIKY